MEREKNKDASKRFRSGIAFAAHETGPTLQWMAEGLRCLAQALGVAAPAPSAMRTALRECLPFNFH